MDTPLGQDRYQTWDELYLYCYRVASTVGLMCLPVMGTAKGYTEEMATEPAVVRVCVCVCMRSDVCVCAGARARACVSAPESTYSHRLPHPPNTQTHTQALGIALQITNILRDVGEDAVRVCVCVCACI